MFKALVFLPLAAIAPVASASDFIYAPLIHCVESSPNAGATYTVLVSNNQAAGQNTVLDAKLILAKPGQPDDMMLLDGGKVTLNHALPFDLSTSGAYDQTQPEGNARLRFDPNDVVVENGQSGFRGEFTATGLSEPATLVCSHSL